MSKTDHLIDVVDQINETQSRVNRDIDARLSKLESRKFKAGPTKSWGTRITGAAKVASYAGPRFGLFLIVTLASVAGAMLGYEAVFEDAGLSQPAWVGLFGASAMILPLSIATFVTRKKEAFKGIKGGNTGGSRYDQF